MQLGRRHQANRTTEERMRIVISEFINLDGVVQAPGGPQEDTDGGSGTATGRHPSKLRRWDRQSTR